MVLREHRQGEEEVAEGLLNHLEEAEAAAAAAARAFQRCW